MSKTLMPSLLEISILKCYNLVVDAVPEIPQKQAESSKPLDLFKHAISGIIIDGNSIIYLHEKVEAFVSMQELNSYQFQKSDYLDKLQFSEWMTKYGVLLLVIISKYLQKLYAETAHEKAVILLKNLLEALQCLIPMISGSFFPQIQSETKIFSKDVPHFNKPLKVPVNSNPFFPQMSPKSKIFPGGWHLHLFKMEVMMNQLRSNPSTQTTIYFFNRLENFGNPTKVPDNSNPFYLQMPPKTKIFEKDGQYFVTPFAMQWFFSKNLSELRTIENLSEYFFKRSKVQANSNLFYSQMPPKTKNAKNGQYFVKSSEMQNIGDIFCSKKPYETKIFGIDLEHFKNLSEVPVNSNSFNLQMPPKSKIFAEDGQYFQKPFAIHMQEFWNRPIYRMSLETKIFVNDLEQFCKQHKFSMTLHPLCVSIPIQKKILACNLDKFCKPPKISPTIDPIFLPSQKKTSANNLEQCCKPPKMPVPIDSLSVPITSQKKISENNLEHFCKPPEIPATIDVCLPIPPQKTIWNAANNLEHCCKPNEEPPTLGPVYPQMPAKTKIFRKDSEHTDDSIKKIPISKPSFGTKRPDTKNFKCVLKMPEMKGSTLNDRKSKRNSKNPRRYEICSLCKEMVTVKKFFGERRFAILEKCDCVICYGCIRKETSTPGVVHGPVCCPLCKVKSNTVASSTHWIKSEEKVNFLEVYRKNVEFLNMKLKMGWTSFRTIKNDFGAWVPKVVLAF